MTRSTRDQRDLAGLYALDALEPDAAAEFEQFMASSPETEREVEEFRRTAAVLAGAETAAPPADLKARVMAEIDTTRQERPTVVALSRRRFSAITVAVAAALVVIAGIAVLLASELDDTNNLVAVLEAPDAITVDLDGDNTPNLRVVWSDALDQAVIVPGESTVLQREVYALWNIEGDHLQPVAVFSGGDSVVVNTGELFDRPGQFAITIEPPGGSLQPTGPIIAGPVSA